MKRIALILLASFVLGFYAQGQWNTNPEENLILRSGQEIINVKSIKANNNKVYVCWFYQEAGNYNLYAQLLDENGNKMWAEEGLLIRSRQPEMFLAEQGIACDAQGNLVVVCSDIANDGVTKLYCQKINQNGEKLFGENELLVFENNNNEAIFSVFVSSDLNGDIILASGTADVDNNTFLQLISENGELPWGIEGKIITNADRPKTFLMGNAVAVLFKEVTGEFPSETINLAYKMFDKEGNELFPDTRYISNAGGISSWEDFYAEVTNSNHVVVSWYDDRNSDLVSEAYVQKVDCEGNALWENNGLSITSEQGMNHFYPTIVGEAGDGLIVIWQRTSPDTQLYKAIYGQKISADGGLLWGDEGKELVEESTMFYRIEKAEILEDDFYIAYGMHPTENSYDTVYYFMGAYDFGGNTIWEQATCFSNSSEAKGFFDLMAIPETQVVVTWLEGSFMSPQKEVRAQNIKLDGTLGPLENGYNQLAVKESITIGPNPATHTCLLKSFDSQIEMIRVFNEKGELVETKHADTMEVKLDMSGMQKGIYFIEVRLKNNGTVYSKLIKA